MRLLALVLLISCLFIGSAEAQVTGGNPTTVSWDGPTTYEDGTPLLLSGLGGYKVYVGTASKTYGPAIDVKIPSNCGTWPHKSCSYVITTLPNGTYYFSVTAYDTKGYESNYSNEVVKTVKVLPSAPSGCTVK
jgi:hypothetical protein